MTPDHATELALIEISQMERRTMTRPPASSHLDVLKTVHLPVRAVGQNIVNAFGVTIARVTFVEPLVAEAIAQLINDGKPAAEQRNADYEAQESRKAALLRKT